MVPGVLRKKFNINNSAIFVGMLSRFEIWSEKDWKKDLANSFKKFQKSREVIDEI